MNPHPMLEWTGFLFGITGVWLTIRKNIWCFPVGMVNVLITAYLVFDRHLFAGVLQQLVYFVLLAAGWLMWLKKKNDSNDFVIGVLSPKEYPVLLAVFIAGSWMMGWLLSRYSTASLPFADSAATVICFIAQWLIARKKIENWYLWMIANPAYVVIYLIKDLPLYAILSAVYFVMAIAGFRQWNRTLKNPQNKKEG